MENPAEELAVGGAKVIKAVHETSQSYYGLWFQPWACEDQYNTSHMKRENSRWQKGFESLILFTHMKILPARSEVCDTPEVPKHEIVTLTLFLQYPFPKSCCQVLHRSLYSHRKNEPLVIKGPKAHSSFDLKDTLQRNHGSRILWYDHKMLPNPHEKMKKRQVTLPHLAPNSVWTGPLISGIIRKQRSQMRLLPCQPSKLNF